MNRGFFSDGTHIQNRKSLWKLGKGSEEEDNMDAHHGITVLSKSNREIFNFCSKSVNLPPLWPIIYPDMTFPKRASLCKRMPHHIPKRNAIHVPQRHPGLIQSAFPFLPGVPIALNRFPRPFRLETSPVPLPPFSPHSSSHGPDHTQVTKSLGTPRGKSRLIDQPALLVQPTPGGFVAPL